MEPLPKRPRAEFEGRSFNHVPSDGRDVGQQTFSSAGKPKPCMKFFSTSGCQFGETCHFLHYVPGGISSLGLTSMVSSSATALAPPKKAPVLVTDPSVTVNGYKTKLCNRFNTSDGCRFGDRCHFAHGQSDLRTPNIASRATVTGPPPGHISAGDHLPNTVGYPGPKPGYPAGFAPRQGYAGPTQPGFGGSNAGYSNPASYPTAGPPENFSSFMHQGHAQPQQHITPANNTSAVVHPENGNVPVY